MYVNEQLVGALKQQLMERDGLAVGTENRPLLADSDGRQGGGGVTPVRVLSRR